jgi:hypothetical protein
MQWCMTYSTGRRLCRYVWGRLTGLAGTAVVLGLYCRDCWLLTMTCSLQRLGPWVPDMHSASAVLMRSANSSKGCNSVFLCHGAAAAAPWSARSPCAARVETQRHTQFVSLTAAAAVSPRFPLSRRPLTCSWCPACCPCGSRRGGGWGAAAYPHPLAHHPAGPGHCAPLWRLLGRSSRWGPGALACTGCVACTATCCMTCAAMCPVMRSVMCPVAYLRLLLQHHFPGLKDITAQGVSSSASVCTPT